jgi:hypothetical protein
MCNEVYIANSVKIITHLVFLLLSPVSANKLMPESVAYAFDILTNIGKAIDLTGRRRRATREYILLDHIEDDERETLKAKCSKHYSISSSDTYIAATHLIFPSLINYMQSNDREYVFKALETFGHLCQNEDNVSLLNNCPNSLPPLLVELLCVNSSASDSIHMTNLKRDADKAYNITSRPPVSVGNMSEQSDTQIRDAASFAIYLLVCMSLPWRRAIASVPHALFILYRIAIQTPRTEAIIRASQIMTVMTCDPGNAVEYLRVQKDFCVGACSEDAISGKYYDYIIICGNHNLLDVLFSATGNNFFAASKATVDVHNSSNQML